MNYINFPSYIPIRHYRENIEKYISYATRSSQVLGLFSMGGLNTPGLSDIDLIVVVRNKIAQKGSLSPFVLGLDYRLFLHNVFIIHPSHVNEFSYIFYATNIQPLFIANDIKITFPAVTAITKELKLIYLIELGKMRLYQLCAIHRSGICDVRRFLIQISSIIHSVNIVTTLGIDLPDSVIDFKNYVVSLRKRWTQEKGMPIENIEHIFERGIRSWCRILEATAAIITHLKGVMLPGRHIRSRWFGIHFSNHDQCHMKKDSKGRYLRPCLPRNLYHHYAGYSEKNNHKYHREQKKRLHLVKDHRKFLNKNRFGYSMKGNLGFPLNRQEFISFLIGELRYLCYRYSLLKS
jgi:hypothetical protein